jgi:hypothetical protein
LSMDDGEDIVCVSDDKRCWEVDAVRVVFYECRVILTLQDSSRHSLIVDCGLMPHGAPHDSHDPSVSIVLVSPYALLPLNHFLLYPFPCSFLSFHHTLFGSSPFHHGILIVLLIDVGTPLFRLWDSYCSYTASLFCHAYCSCHIPIVLLFFPIPLFRFLLFSRVTRYFPLFPIYGRTLTRHVYKDRS